MSDHLFTAKYKWELIDPLLIECYQSRKVGALSKLSRQLGIPGATLGERARIKLGLNGWREKGKDYIKEEDDILIKNTRQPMTVIVKKLAQAGYSRNADSVAYRLVALRRKEVIPGIQEELEELSIFTVDRLALEMGITAAKIHYWISQKKLRANKQPLFKGTGHTRRFLIPRKEVREFLIQHELLYDHKLCSHSFLINVLTGT